MTTVRPACALVGDDLADALGRRQVEPGDGLVEQQHVGLLGEALGHEHALALAAGQLGEVAVGEVLDVEPPHGVGHGVAVGAPQRPERAERRGPRQGDGLADGDRQRGRDRRRLQHVADPADDAAPCRATGSMSPATACSSVDLPDPLGPTSAVTPGRSDSDSTSSTRRRPRSTATAATRSPSERGGASATAVGYPK